MPPAEPRSVHRSGRTARPAAWSPVLPGCPACNSFVYVQSKSRPTCCIHCQLQQQDPLASLQGRSTGESASPEVVALAASAARQRRSPADPKHGPGVAAQREHAVQQLHVPRQPCSRAREWHAGDGLEEALRVQNREAVTDCVRRCPRPTANGTSKGLYRATAVKLL